jgi:signal transduction histidine kinase
MTDPAHRDERQDERRPGARSGPAPGGMSGVHLRLAILPATAVAVLGIATVAFLLVGGRSVTATRIVLVAAAALAALALIVAVTGAASATRRLQLQVAGLRRASSRAQDELALLTERARRGEQPPLAVLAGPDAAGSFEPAADSDGFAELAGDLERERHAARLAVGQAVAQAAGLAAVGELAAVAGRAASGGPDPRIEVFVNLARRMQSLVHQEIRLLDNLEAQVEDPALLEGLFGVDHLATRMRRQSESLAVLGGAVARRQWSRPVTVHEALRAAVAEVEQYSRVTVVPPVDGTLPGHAVTDVIHLVAELIENATKFSAPHTQAMVRAQLATAGLVVEVEDRGLGMRAADQQRLNALLADPSRVNTGELLRDGRIGLFVVATLARRHGIRVQLQGNIHGGVQAVIVLPLPLIEAAPAGRDEATQYGSSGTAPAGADETTEYGSGGTRQARSDETTQPGADEPEPAPLVTREPAAAGALPARRRSAAPPPEGTSTSSAPRRRVPASTLPARHRATAAPAGANTPSGEMTPGAVAPGVPDPGETAPGAMAPGVPEPGEMASAVVTPGVSEPGETAPGVVIPGVPEPGDMASAVGTPGVSEPGEMNPGAVVPGVSEPVRRPPARRKPSAPRTLPARRRPPALPTLDAPDAPDAPDAASLEPPELPSRVSQTHLAPELREARAQRRDGPADDQIPGLMADFQRGISRAAEEDRPAETDSPR